MSIVEQEIAYVDEESPSLTQQIPADWFSPRIWSALHAHPLDATIRYTSDRTFYVAWFESAAERPAVSETVSVTSLVSSAPKDVVVHTGGGTHDDRREVGIRMHRWMECILNGLPIPDVDIYSQMRSYVSTLRYLPWRTEMPIRSCTRTCVVGVVDALFVVECHGDVLVLDMVDWKYSANVSSCLDEYELQLNMYKYILETTYGGTPFQVGGTVCTSIRIRNMSLVLFHPSITTHQTHTVPDRQPEVAALFRLRKMQLASEDKCPC